jgi:hypothetical protein
MIQWYTNNNAVTAPGCRPNVLEMPLVFPLARIFANPNHSLASLSVTMLDLLSLTLGIRAVLRKSVTRFIHNNIAKSLAVLTEGELKASEAPPT